MIHLSTQLNFSGGVSFLDKVLFTKHLSIMLKSGIPLSEAIEIIADQTTHTSFKVFLHSVEKKISNGQALHTVFSAYPQYFDPLYLSLLRMGEESGTLEANLEYLSSQMKKQYDFRKKVQGALMYPAVIIFTAVGVGGGISVFVLPKLIDLFKSLDVKLPLTTRILLAFSELMRAHGILMFVGAIVALIGLRALLVFPKIRLPWQKMLLSLPIIGIFLQEVQLSFFCRNFGVMLKSGLPLTAALEASETSTSNLVFRGYIQKISKDVKNGQTIENSFAKNKFRFMPLLAARMIGVGEHTGRLDESLLYLADFFEGEVDDMSKNFSTILEPVLLLVVGLLVAFLAFSIISPIYELTASIHK